MENKPTYEELQAQVEALKSAAEKMMFKGRIVSNVCYNIGQRHEDSEQILQAVREYDTEVHKFHDAVSIGPQQHLAEIRAQAWSLGFDCCDNLINENHDAWYYDDGFSALKDEAANQYADSIRKGEVK